MQRIITVFICWLINTCLVSCQSKQSKTTMEKYYWSPTECAPTNYPARIYRSCLAYEGGSVYVPSSALINNGWGEDGSTHAVGEDFKPVPHRLDLTWFSYTESKFYTGSFELPKERINDLFREGYWHKHLKKQLTYTMILVGMAPGGVVVVWLKSGAQQIEVGRFQAHDTIVSMRDFIPSAYYDDPEVYAKDILSDESEIANNLSKNGIPYGLWDTYREHFFIHPTVELEDSSSITKQLLLFYFNEEKEDVTTKLQLADQYSSKARVKRIGITWEQNDKQYVANLSLKETELFNAYKSLYTSSLQKVELLIRVNSQNDSVKVYLRNKEKQILLPATYEEIYQLNRKI